MVWLFNSGHILVNTIQESLRLSKVSEETFSYWCKEVREGFAIANYMSLLPTNLLPPGAIKGRQVDPRSLFEHYNQLSVSYNSLFAQKIALQDDVHHLRNDVTALTRSNQRLEAVVAQQANLLSRVVEVLEIKHNKQCPPSPSSESISTPLFFSDSMKNLKKDASIQELFVAFFYRRCMEGYQLELQKSGIQFKIR